MQIKKIAMFLLSLLIVYFYSEYTNSNREFIVALTDGGYLPNNLNIKKGDSVRFRTNLGKTFWPASDPHPTHTGNTLFDPKHGIKSTEEWKYRFIESGVFPYHDHLSANFRGIVTVQETNPLVFLQKNFSKFFRSFEKHDENFLSGVSGKCRKESWSERQEMIDCWNGFFTGITNNFGAEESMRLLKIVDEHGMIAHGDCHLYSDQIGTEAYWKLLSGKKFTPNQNFAMCDNGFMHGFMMEYMSHGQDLKASEKYCEGLESIDKSLASECFSGIGIGLSYYAWGLVPDSNYIAETALEKCNHLDVSHRDDCLFGVFGGLEHLFLGIHGSELRVNQEKPFSICDHQERADLRDYCYTRLAPPLFGDMNFDTSKIVKAILGISTIEARNSVAEHLGTILSQMDIYETQINIAGALDQCHRFPESVANYCVKGVFEGLFSGTENLSGFSCKESYLSESERKTCESMKV